MSVNALGALSKFGRSFFDIFTKKIALLLRFETLKKDIAEKDTFESHVENIQFYDLNEQADEAQEKINKEKETCQ